MKNILIISFILLANATLYGQVKDFPVDENTHKIAFYEILQNLDLSKEEITTALQQWYVGFYNNSLDHLDNAAEIEGRIFLNVHTTFPLHSIEKGEHIEYTIRMNYDLRFFIHDADLRYQLTNITYGTGQKPKMMEAEVLFDEWHINTAKAEAQDPEERDNLESSYQQYKANTIVIIDRVVESFIKAVAGD